jgi:outer membrane protein TolC
MLVARATQAHNELGRQRGKIFPELSAYGRVSKQTFSNEFNFFGGSQPWYNVSVIGLRLDWNLFTGFNRQATIRQSALQAKIADLELENYSRQSEKELLDLTVNHQVATEGLERFAEHFRINSANYRIAGEKYREGVYSIDQYVTIYQETVLSQNRYLNQLADYLIYESMIQSRNAIHE